MVDPSYAPGVRILRVPDGSDGRVDRYVADATGLSRSYVQKLISDGRLTAGVQRPGIVHRLDRDTSGLIIVARRDSAQASVMAQLKARRVKKTYLALVQGSVSAAVGRIEAPIGRDPKHRTKMAVVHSGRPSVTGYRVRERFSDWTLLELDLVTGRTHQIRVHLEAIGHPIAGHP